MPDPITFGEICLYVLPLVIFSSLILWGFLGAIAQRSSIGIQIITILSYIFCIGVILHESAHVLFSKVFGVPIKKIRYFYVEHTETPEKEFFQAGGEVQLREINSVIAALFLGIAPLIINGILVALIFFYSPILAESPYYAIFIYLGIALGLNAHPSKEDLVLWLKAFKHSPKRAFFEICLMLILGIILYVFAYIYQIPIWITITMSISFLLILILLARI